MGEWFHNWFNEDYLNLYSHRNKDEAENQISFLFRHLNIPSKACILDLGCGAGRHAKLLAEKGYEVVGLDASETLIKEAKKEGGASFVVGDMRRLEGLGRFDLVTSFFTSFGYFEDEENRAVLRQIAAVLNPGGHFFLDFLNPELLEKQLVPREELKVGEETVQIERRIEKRRVEKSIRFPGRSYSESVKLYTKEEIEEMLRDAGLKPLRFWSGYSQQKQDRQLFLSRRE